MITKGTLQTDFVEKVEYNYKILEKYFDFKLELFHEFSPRIYEINRCLMIGATTAAITLTNHTLERLLKVALIEHEHRNDGKKQLHETDFEPAHNKYSKLVMFDSLKLCYEKGIILELEYDVLNSHIRHQFRNGFSHAESDKILKDVPEFSNFYHVNLNDVMGSDLSKIGFHMKPIELKSKFIPVLQAAHLDDFVKTHAIDYFDLVFTLIKNVDMRLKKIVKAVDSSNPAGNNQEDDGR